MRGPRPTRTSGSTRSTGTRAARSTTPSSTCPGCGTASSLGPGSAAEPPASGPRPTRRGTAMWFGGDYNPEQWPPSVWAEDFALMRQAGVNLVTVGVFSWSRLQPAAGSWETAWLDQVMDGLHENGIGVCLATPTASPPPWFTKLNPEALPVTRDGVRLTHGSRDTYCVTSNVYRSASVRIASSLSERYGRHPALRMWHVHNEYGSWCFCANCGQEFRMWLRQRYQHLASLNEAWSTDFWSQRYSSWEEIAPPRATQYLI